MAIPAAPAVALRAASLFDIDADLAERLDVRLHTHLAEDPDDDAYCRAKFGRSPVEHFDELGWASPRSWVLYCIHPSDAEVGRLGAAGVGVAHCPSSNMILGGGGMCPVQPLRAAGSPVGLGCDGSSSNDAASLWLEARTALLLGRQRGGPTAMSARDVLDMATRGGAACLGRAGVLGELSPGSAGDLVVWAQRGPQFAGAHSDPIAPWLRCGPVSARHTIVNGELVVRGERKRPELADGSRWAVIERAFGTFERRLRLPPGVDPDAITASVDNGVLSMIVPKPEALKPKTIAIESGSKRRELETTTA